MAAKEFIGLNEIYFYGKINDICKILSDYAKEYETVSQLIKGKLN